MKTKRADEKIHQICTQGEFPVGRGRKPDTQAKTYVTLINRCVGVGDRVDGRAGDVWMDAGFCLVHG